LSEGEHRLSLALRPEEFRGRPGVPVVQGWTVSDYQHGHISNAGLHLARSVTENPRRPGAQRGTKDMKRSTLLVQLTLVLSCSSVNSQQPIAPAPLLEFADNKQWVLFDDMKYEVGTSGVVITVPKGFVTA